MTEIRLVYALMVGGLLDRIVSEELTGWWLEWLGAIGSLKLSHAAHV